MQTHTANGIFRFWVRGFQILELANRFGLSLTIEFPSTWHDDHRGLIHIHLIWPGIYIGFPWYKVYEDLGPGEGPRFGFQFFDDLLWIFYGKSTGRLKDDGKTTIRMPWSWNHVRHSVVTASGKLVPFIGSWEHKGNDSRVTQTYLYHYVLKSGDVQKRLATVYVEEREWRRRFWFPRTMIRRCIHVAFDGEVGERTGSWKGGTIGCGYALREGESPLECLRRMEGEREFN